MPGEVQHLAAHMHHSCNYDDHSTCHASIQDLLNQSDVPTSKRHTSTMQHGYTPAPAVCSCTWRLLTIPALLDMLHISTEINKCYYNSRKIFIAHLSAMLATHLPMPSSTFCSMGSGCFSSCCR